MYERNIHTYVELVIEHAKKNGIELTPLKLQKVLYYLQAWSLAFSGDDLFDDVPQAWVRGPVYPAVYTRFCQLKATPIVHANATVNTAALLAFPQTEFTISALRDQEQVLEAVLHEYVPKTAEWLVRQTHCEKPWLEARAGLDSVEPSSKELSKETMKTYYSSSIHQHQPLNPFASQDVSASDFALESPLAELQQQWENKAEYFTGISKEEVMQRAQHLMMTMQSLKPSMFIVSLTYDHDLYVRAEIAGGRSLHASVTFGEDSDPEDDTFLAMFLNGEEQWNVSCAFHQTNETIYYQLVPTELVA
ncbi:Panacea domain-containing protein [Hymenobacter chitinivorans]|uniref:Putative phage-associated protein n=1 Tax=Hymenobacter chitinivorans DSM 11115 TaxID=1121954 RepID=A0A2M9BN79_9BACT|nr:type II toxin-antitoxin system antitoxin SocA domain-containing protein [Hymenobacter chitinivorans]PJJ59404.1 putative phage-associated protein [Hymenobacter chitinivorans DSM 11115]